MDREEILRVAEGPDADGWSAADATLLRAADELHEHAKIGSPRVLWVKGRPERPRSARICGAFAAEAPRRNLRRF